MREELKAGNRGIFSVPLRNALRRALEEEEQSILFVNRRGAARFLLCRACGYLPTCPTCALAMGLDTRDLLHPRIFCHHCGRSRTQETTCPECGSARYRPFGVGTQRIEEEAKRAFPEARVRRWDSDAASRKGSHEAILKALEAREVDILVGTQMLAKGLDLPAMTVVGVVDADVGLSLPDYVAHERTFQLLSQVAGRAGRRERRGEVYIQTYEPEAPPIHAAAEHDYRGFFAHETQHRRRASYPPLRAAGAAHLPAREPGAGPGARVAGRGRAAGASRRRRLARPGRARPDARLRAPPAGRVPLAHPAAGPRPARAARTGHAGAALERRYRPGKPSLNLSFPYCVDVGSAILGPARVAYLCTGEASCSDQSVPGVESPSSSRSRLTQRRHGRAALSRVARGPRGVPARGRGA